MSEDNMKELENGGTIGVQSFEQRREIDRQNGISQAYDPEKMLDASQNELEANTFELLEDALIHGTKISREDATRISERYSKDYFEGTRKQRERAAIIVAGIIDTFKDDLDVS